MKYLATIEPESSQYRASCRTVVRLSGLGGVCEAGDLNSGVWRLESRVSETVTASLLHCFTASSFASHRPRSVGNWPSVFVCFWLLVQRAVSPWHHHPASRPLEQARHAIAGRPSQPRPYGTSLPSVGTVPVPFTLPPSPACLRASSLPVGSSDSLLSLPLCRANSCSPLLSKSARHVCSPSPQQSSVACSVRCRDTFF